VRTITPETPDAYSMLKNVLITRFSPTQIDNCFKLLDMPPMGDRHPLACQALRHCGSLPADGNLRCIGESIYMRGMSQAMRAAV
jgi:hypothetical protein